VKKQTGPFFLGLNFFKSVINGPATTLVADVKSALSATSPLNAGSLIKAGVKVSLDSKALVGVNREHKIGLLGKALVLALTEMKEKEAVGCSDEQKAAVNDRYAQLTLVAESGLPAVLETVHEIFNGKAQCRLSRFPGKADTCFMV
jgi:hypothetical protein